MVPASMALPFVRRSRRASLEGLSDASLLIIARVRARSRPWRSGARDTPRRRCHKWTSIPVPREVEDPPDAPGPATVTPRCLSGFHGNWFLFKSSSFVLLTRPATFRISQSRLDSFL